MTNHALLFVLVLFALIVLILLVSRSGNNHHNAAIKREPIDRGLLFSSVQALADANPTESRLLSSLAWALAHASALPGDGEIRLYANANDAQRIEKATGQKTFFGIPISTYHIDTELTGMYPIFFICDDGGSRVFGVGIQHDLRCRRFEAERVYRRFRSSELQYTLCESDVL